MLSRTTRQQSNVTRPEEHAMALTELVDPITVAPVTVEPVTVDLYRDIRKAIRLLAPGTRCFQRVPGARNGRVVR